MLGLKSICWCELGSFFSDGLRAAGEQEAGIIADVYSR